MDIEPNSALDPTVIPRILDARARRMSTLAFGVTRELMRVRAERETYRGAIERAVHDLKQGWTAAALDALERALTDAPEAA